MMKKLLFLSWISLSVFAQKLIVDLPHYQTLALLDKAGNEPIDTLKFPWASYSESGIRNALMRPYFLNLGQIEALKKGFLPPANSSEQTKAEISFLKKLQETRSPEDIQRSMVLANIGYQPYIINPTHQYFVQNQESLMFMGLETISPTFTSINYPKTAALLHGIMQDVRVVEFELKLFHRRPRPYHLDVGIKNLQTMQSPAFPSGHTLMAFANALIYSELLPTKKSDFMAFANELRFSREVLGIHFPSDNENARLMAYKMLEYWKKNPDYIQSLAAAKKELRSK